MELDNLLDKKENLQQIIAGLIWKTTQLNVPALADCGLGFREIMKSCSMCFYILSCLKIACLYVYLFPLNVCVRRHFFKEE